MTEALWATYENGPHLMVGRCQGCGYRFHPPQQYGCEACGATDDSLESIAVPARGELFSFATVHLHPTEPTPFTIALTTLDDAPEIVIESRLDHAEPRIGGRVRGEIRGDSPDDAVFCFVDDEQEQS